MISLADAVSLESHYLQEHGENDCTTATGDTNVTHLVRLTYTVTRI